MKKYASVVQLKPECVEKYIELHANTWQGVLDALREVNIENYSIFFREIGDQEFFLFSYFQYTGSDFDGDMQRLAAVSIIQEWWKITDPCMFAVEGVTDDTLWSPLEQVFDDGTYGDWSEKS